jgi:hypothetical protein
MDEKAARQKEKQSESKERKNINRRKTEKSLFT